MTPNPMPEDSSLTPFIVARLFRRATFTANFGQGAFQFLTDEVLRSIADARTAFARNPERLPTAWSQYPALPSVCYGEDDCLVTCSGISSPAASAWPILTRPLDTSGDMTPVSDSSEGGVGCTFRSNLPIPQSVDVPYFEVEFVSLPLDGYVLFPHSSYLGVILTCVWQ